MRKIAREIVLMAAALAALSTPVRAAPLDAQIDPIVAQQKQDQHIPGLALLVVKDDQIVYAKAFGLRDLESGQPVTLDTLFPIGSCTKAFTAMAVALSADAGLLSLDDHPRKFLPWFKMYDPQADAEVTLRDMLSHQTGLKAYADLAAEPGVLTRDEYIRAATSAKPAVKFRSKFQYSNAMVTAAGEIAGVANHSTWEQVVENRIFRPLGMTSSLASTFAALKTPDHVTGYVYDDAAKTWHAAPPPGTLEQMAPAGNIASSAHDMALWLQMLSDGGVAGGKRFVSQAMFDEMTAPKIAVSAQWSYALGWVIYDWNGHKVVEHNGGSEGISALVSFIPSRHAGFVFLANTSPNYMTKVGNAGKLLWPIILNESPAAAAEPTPSPAPAQTAPAATPDRTLPSADALVARMIVAEGGARALRRHATSLVHATKSYENQGVSAEVTILSKAPAMSDATEIWSAAGKKIGTVRVYFDGANGGQETTFGQNAKNDASANAQAARDNALHPLLELHKLYKEVSVTGREKVGDDDAFVLRLVPDKGDPVELIVAAKSALILRRRSANVSESFSDYRWVDGERIAFRDEVEEPLGETVTTVTNGRFNANIPPGSFSPAKSVAR